jgi:hypothetical protein
MIMIKVMRDVPNARRAPGSTHTYILATSHMPMVRRPDRESTAVLKRWTKASRAGGSPGQARHLRGVVYIFVDFRRGFEASSLCPHRCRKIMADIANCTDQTTISRSGL